MKHHFSLLLFFLFFATVSFAQKNLMGLVKDKITQAKIDKVSVLIYKDTTLISKAETNLNMQINSTNGYWVASVPAEGGTFRFCFIKEGYEYLEKVVEIEPFKKLEFIRFAFNTELKRKPKEKQLNDVVIKATKIKFYNKGDTLIYNADAFNLAEGSMLDNLVKSIPGAELNDNGEIKVNGRKIDALLLNGEDFFKGKNNIMLDNLPAYMVKNIKVYDRKDPYALLTGKNLEGDYVMDVNLKKQYSIGNIGNMEVGMGSENRYLARLFALRFTDASRIGVYANFNNLNDKRKPGENSNWTPDNMPSGLLAQKMGGIDYNFKPKYSLNKFTGNVELAYTSLDSHSETAKETFLPEGNTYSKSRRTERNSNFGASTFHIWELRKANGLDGIEIKPSLRYNHFDRLSGGLAATFNENPYDYAKNKALLDSIQNMNGENLRRIMLNRNCRDIKSRGYDFFANTEVVYKYFYRNYIGFSLAGNIKYDYKKDETFDIYNLRYPSQPQQASQYLNTFINNKPDRTFGYSLSPLIALIPSSSFNISLKLTFGQNNRTHTYSRYNLEKLDEWGEDNEHVIGELPSETDYKLHTFDRLNSFDFYETDKYYGCEITYYYQSSSINAKEKIKKNKPFFVVSFPVMFHHKRLNYERGEWYFGKVHRNTTLLSPYIQYKLKRNNSEEYSFEYHVKQKSPSMTSLLDIENTSDPLNIYCGNRELKNSTEHDVFFLYAIRNKKKETMFTVKTRYVTTVNALAYIYNVDRTTGVNTYTPDNVNGNYNLSTTFWYDCPLDKKHKLTLSGSTVLRLDHGVDYITEDLKEDPLRSTVNTWSGTEKVELKYKFGKHSLGTKGYMKLNRVTSTRKDFRSINLCDFHYGLTSLISLPWQLQVSTDLTMYCRRGYNDSGVNTNDLVWNARLSKTFTKAGLTLMVDGFDILGNLSNVSQVLNSQGRTETWRNSLPRYVMFHAVYRFNKQPKKSSLK